MKRPRLCCMVIEILACSAIISVLGTPHWLFADQASDNTRLQNLADKGSDMYEKYCAMCHGPNGKGYLADEASALSNQDFLKSADDEYILQGILRGRPGTAMSAWGTDNGGILTRADAEALLAFIRSWQKEPSVEISSAEITGNAENGMKLFQRWCAACHGKYGIGGKAIQLNNTVFQETASDGYIKYAIENGRRNTKMTAYKNTLSAGDINDLVAYIRTLKTMDTFSETVDVAEIEELSNVIREKALLNPGNPPAEFALTDDRFVAADDVFAAYKEKQSFILIDARPSSDYLRSHITGAISIPFYDIENAVGMLPKDIWIIAYCACPHALSGKVMDTLISGGYEKVAILNEGFFYWLNEEYPSESSVNKHIPAE